MEQEEEDRETLEVPEHTKRSILNLIEIQKDLGSRKAFSFLVECMRYVTKLESFSKTVR